VEGCSLGVNLSWICYGVSTGPFARDCPSPLHEEGLACCGRHWHLYWEFEEKGGRLRGTLWASSFRCH